MTVIRTKQGQFFNSGISGVPIITQEGIELSGQVLADVLASAAYNHATLYQGDDIVIPGPDTNYLAKFASVLTSKLPLSLAGPQIHPSPPTVTLSAPNAATSISGGVDVPCDTNRITRMGGGGFQKGPSFPFDLFLYPTHRYPNNVDTGGPAPWTALFGFDGTKLEIFIQDRQYSAKYRLWVDGKPLTATPVPVGGPNPASGNGYRIIINFGTAAKRIIQFDMGLIPFGGFTTGPNDTIWPVTPRGPRVIFEGDSYLGGAYTDPSSTFYRFASDLLGWQDIWNNGVGGSGYTKSGGIGTFPTRVPTELIPWKPDIAVFAGGINDADQTETAIYSAARATFQPVRDALPDCILIALGPWCPNEANTNYYAPTGNAIKQAIESVDGIYIDTLTSSWITGSGDTGAPTGTGNADIYIGPDNVHPTDAGSAYLGYRLAEAIFATLPKL